MSAKPNEQFWIEHLMRRAGFGATPDELKHYKSLGYHGTLNELLHPESVDNSQLENTIAQQNFDFLDPTDLKRWWVLRMAFGKRPLEEKMTLFWHGHFATSNRKVRNAYAMYLQNLMLRKYALGNFRDLLLAISQDPAMIVWLDNQQNRKGNPNENYGREIMELFTLGIGNYSEADIKAAARAFTGWHTRHTDFFFNERQHDYGVKTLLGTTGNLNGGDVVSLLAKKPQTGKHLAKKLIKYYAVDEPQVSYVNEVAAVYQTSGGNIRRTVEAVFKHPDFCSEKSYHAKIKSPCELVVGTIKTLQISKLDGDLPSTLSRMGQDLFEPPNVKGWDGGAAWISTDTMMERFNFAARIAQDKFDAMKGYFSPSQMIYRQGLTNAKDVVDYFLDLLVDGDVPESTRQRLIMYVSTSGRSSESKNLSTQDLLDAKLRGLTHLIMSLPTYQLG